MIKNLAKGRRKCQGSWDTQGDGFGCGEVGKREARGAKIPF